jgi:hypothetical protein
LVRLDNLAVAYAIDPDILNRCLQTPHVFLSCPSKSGGKFWEGSLSINGLNRCWGKLHGGQGASKFIPVENCAKNNPVLELKNRVMEKLRKGYRLVFTKTFLPLGRP